MTGGQRISRKGAHVLVGPFPQYPDQSSDGEFTRPRPATAWNLSDLPIDHNITIVGGSGTRLEMIHKA